MAQDVQVFISWSGTLSNGIAKELKSMLQVASDRLTPFMSEQDIHSGQRGLAVIADQLNTTSVGLLVVTADNWNSPWINYEAGALAKEVGDAEHRVVPLLVDIVGTDLANSPLTQFQYRALTRQGITEILLDLARLAAIDGATVVARVMSHWDEYEARFKELLTKHPPAERRKRLSEADLLREVLETVREIKREVVSGDGHERPRSPILADPKARAAAEKTLRRHLLGLGIDPVYIRSAENAFIVGTETEVPNEQREDVLSYFGPYVQFEALGGKRRIIRGSESSRGSAPDPSTL